MIDLISAESLLESYLINKTELKYQKILIEQCENLEFVWISQFNIFSIKIDTDLTECNFWLHLGSQTVTAEINDRNRVRFDCSDTAQLILSIFNKLRVLKTINAELYRDSKQIILEEIERFKTIK